MDDRQLTDGEATSARERAVDDLGRSAGAALRGAAPADGLDRITHTVRRQRAARATAALATVTGVVVLGAMVLRRHDDPSPASPATTEQAVTPTTTLGTSPTSTVDASTSPTPQVTYRDEWPVRAARMIAYSPDGAYILMPTGSSIDRYDATTFEFVDILPCDRFPPDDSSRDAAIAEARSLSTRVPASGCGVYGYSPDGTRATTDGDGAVDVIDVATSSTLATLPLPTAVGYPSFGRYSPDGSMIITWGIHAAAVWDPTTFQQRFVLEGDDSGPASAHGGLSFSDDSRLVAGSSNDVATVWDTSTGKQVAEIRAQTAILGAVLSPDGSVLATSGYTGDNALYDVASGQRIWEFDGQLHDVVGAERSITYMAFSPDGQTLAICYWNGTDNVVRRYDLTSRRT